MVQIKFKLESKKYMSPKSYNRLIINGELFENSQLQYLCDSKLNSSSTPDWEKSCYRFINHWIGDKEFISITTSGSTGEAKKIEFSKDLMIASAQLTKKTFKLNSNDKALFCLSADHIAGKMMIVRAFVCGLNLILREPSSNPLANISEQIDFAAMVPLQVNNALKYNRKKLENIRKLIIGGATIREELIGTIANFPNEVYGTYGMTETLTHIAISNLKKSKTKQIYEALEGVSLAVDEKNCLIIDAKHLGIKITTNDLVNLIDSKHFQILGRHDNIINSGGLKFNPEVIEKKLESIIDSNYLISSISDETLGERIVLIIESNKYALSSLYELWTKIEAHLDKLEIPKHIEFLSNFTYTQSGKIDREKTRKILDIRY